MKSTGFHQLAPLNADEIQRISWNPKWAKDPWSYFLPCTAIVTSESRTLYLCFCIWFVKVPASSFRHNYTSTMSKDFILTKSMLFMTKPRRFSNSVMLDKWLQFCVLVYNCKFLIIEKVHLDDLDVLWLSVVKLAKKFNSTSFKLKQEAFIKRDEDWPDEGWYLYRNWFDTLEITRWTVKFNIHTSFGGWLICDQCHCRCEVTYAIKSEVWWHIFTPLWLILRWKEWHYLIHVRC